MNLYFRLFLLIFKVLRIRKKVDLLATARCTFRVHLNDLDFNFHMNNGRYLTIMDLARLDFMAQTGILWPSLKKKWFPILGETQMTFYRPLGLFQKYQIETTIIGWDEKWIIMQQDFYSKGKLAARGRVRGLLRGKKGNIPPFEILSQLGGKYPRKQHCEGLNSEWADLIEKMRKV